MRLEEFTLYRTVYSNDEMDSMGNPKPSQQQIGTAKGRFSAWTVDDVELYGRELTQRSDKVLLQGAHLETDFLALSDGKRLEIKHRSVQGRWTVLIVERWRAR